jgi:uncharacterized repeat protein (TIGR01451 family)
MSLLALSAALLFSGDAEAARLANIETTLTVPASVQPHANLSYSVNVANSGRQDANNVELTIQLPETNTSPTVHVMGVLSNVDSACTQVGTTLECSLGKIRKGRSASVGFTLAVPNSSAPWTSSPRPPPAAPRAAPATTQMQTRSTWSMSPTPSARPPTRWPSTAPVRT